MARMHKSFHLLTESRVEREFEFTNDSFRRSPGEGKCIPQSAAGPRQKLFRLLDPAALQEKHRELEVSMRLLKRVAHLIQTFSRQMDEHLFPPPDELRVHGLDLDHQSGINPAKPDHRQ